MHERDGTFSHGATCCCVRVCIPGGCVQLGASSMLSQVPDPAKDVLRPAKASDTPQRHRELQLVVTLVINLVVHDDVDRRWFEVLTESCLWAPLTGAFDVQSDGALSGAGSALAPQPSHATSTNSGQRGSMHNGLPPASSVDTSHAASVAAMPVPPAGAPLATLVAFIQSQLDTIGPHDIVLSQFKLQGSSASDRCIGGVSPRHMITPLPPHLFNQCICR